MSTQGSKATDAIVQSVQNVTCSAATAATVQDILFGSLRDKKAADNGRKKATAATGAAPRKPTASKQGQNAKPLIKVHSEEGLSKLSNEEKSKFATETFNAALKALSSAAKQQVSSTTSPEPNPLKNRHTSKTDTTQQIRSETKPLQVRSPNSPEKPPQSRTQASAASPKRNIALVAECARFSLEYMRRTARADVINTTLENGTLAFVSKCLALGLESVATKELRAMKARLDATIFRKPRKSTPKDEEQGCLCKLLEFPTDNEVDTASSGLIVNFQMHVLRLIAVAKKSLDVKALLKHLTPENSGSLVSILLRQASDEEARTKCARQLETISQIVISSICPNISASSDQSVSNGSQSQDHDSTLLLQILGFRIRIMSYEQSKRSCSVETEIWAPFSKCLAAFMRRSKSKPESKYRMAKSEFDYLDEFLDSSNILVQQDARMPSKASCLRLLSDLAQAAGFYDEAIALTQTSSVLTPTKSPSSVKKAISNVRLARLMLLGEKEDTLKHQMETAKGCLIETLRGEASDLDQLLLEAASYRRAIMTKFLAEQDNKSQNKEMINDCMHGVFGCIRFLLRYLGTVPTADADSKTVARYSEKLTRASKAVAGFTDSVLHCCKIGIQESTVDWLALDTALYDTYQVALQIQAVTEAGEVGGQSTEKGYDSDKTLIKLSTLYWAYYNRIRKSTSATGLMQALNRSIEVLQGGNLHVKTAGVFSSKLEALAHAYELANRYQHAYDALQRGMAYHVESGNLTTIAQSASTQSFEALWNTTAGLAVSSTLDKIPTYMLRADKASGLQLSWFIPDSLDDEAKAIFYERQLYCYCNEMLKGRFWDSDHSKRLDTAFGALFEIYTPEKYPVRRQRVAVLASRIMNEQPEVLGQSIIDQVLRSKTQHSIQKSDDSSLETYAAHFTATLIVNLALMEGKMDIVKIKEALGIWQHLVEDTAGLSDRIDGLSSLISQLQVLADYFDVVCLPYLRLPTLALLVRLMAKVREPSSKLLETQYELALQYIRMGYSGHAGLILANCDTVIEKQNPGNFATLEYHLAYANFSLAVGNSSKCKDSLASAEQLVDACPELNHLTTGSKATSLSQLIKSYQILSQALEITSMMHLQTGNLDSALYCGRKCIKILQKTWLLLENGSSPKQPVGSPTATDVDSALNGSGESNKTAGVSLAYDSLKGARFWGIIPPLRRAYYLIAEIYAHNGLFGDTHWAILHAQRVAEALSSPISMVHQHSIMAELWIRGGDVENGQRYLDQAVEIQTDGPSLELARHYGTVAQMWKVRGETDDEIEALDQAVAIMEKLMRLNLSTLDRIESSEDALVSRMSSMRIEDAPAPAVKRGRSKLVKKAPMVTKSKAVGRAKPKAAPVNSKSPRISLRGHGGNADHMELDCVPLVGMRAEILTHKAVALQETNNLQLAQDALVMAGDVKTSTSQFIRKKLVEFRQSAKSALKSIVTDCTFGLLPESTISIPSLAISDANVAIEQVSKPSKVVARKGKSTTQKKVNNFTSELEVAKRTLIEYQLIASTSSSTFDYHQLCNRLVSTSFFLAAASPNAESSSAASLAAAWLLDHPAIITSKRGKSAAKTAERSFEKHELHEWPSVSRDMQAYVETESMASLAQFQKMYIDIIPNTWTVFSLHLSESKDDLYISQYKPNQTPFVLRLPLKSRSHSEDEDVFGYDEGRAELLEIIELSNQTAKEAAALGVESAEAKKSWWAEREELDDRLGELLLNIERIWLGGFAGVFANQERQPLLLARFQKALQTSLNRHLPSRRSKGQQKTANFDSRVLELFTGLGEPKDDNESFDESLNDLLYFVVDILQFNGEPNAYDEIDFDSLIIETTDALRAYHSAAIAPDNSNQAHTILILDKHLHGIPWESLSCLDRVNVSRVESFESLRCRLMAARERQNALDNPGHRASKSSGCSLLNPSGDLKRTELTLQPLLKTLPGKWTHTKETPTEEQLLEELNKSDVYLYFGHGSGAQFMRPRALRGKDSCPTAWLMGCSSAALTTHGEFQPSALLLGMLDAGAPAVVGCLWDVTDKDCDRASIRIGEAWGLWRPGKEHEKLLSETRSSSRVFDTKSSASWSQEVENPRGVMATAKIYGELKGKKPLNGARRGELKQKSLPEAVRIGRQSCRLRYLNGAALVVYGIPVYLYD